MIYLISIFYRVAGQYVTLSLLKNYKNGERVNIYKIVTEQNTVHIPPTIIQVGHLSNYDTFQEQINFKAQKHLSIHYYKDDGQPHTTTLQHLKQVTPQYL